jgi:hypothetical protein
MDLPNLPIVEFYGEPQPYCLFIVISDANGKHYMRLGYSLQGLASHPALNDRFRDEVLAKLADPDHPELFYRNYDRKGGGNALVLTEHPETGATLQKPWIRLKGKSGTYGEPDWDLVKRVLEESQKFEVIKIGKKAEGEKF